MNHQIARINLMDWAKLRRLGLPGPGQRSSLWTFPEGLDLRFTLTASPGGLIVTRTGRW